MESLTCQGQYQEATENTQLVKFLPMLLNLLLVLYTNLSKNQQECGKVVRIVLVIQYIYSGYIYCSWALQLIYLLYIIILFLNFESLFDLDFSIKVPYIHYSASKWSTLFQLILTFSMFLPDSNSVSVPYNLAAFSFLFINKFSMIVQKYTDRSALQVHFMILKYVPVGIALGNTLYICFIDNQVYLDHIIVLGVICGSMGFKGNFVEVREKVRVKSQRKVREEAKFNIFELRPKCDGGEQGKSTLPYYMDDDGDVANEFYEEVNKKLVKVSIDKLKLV